MQNFLYVNDLTDSGKRLNKVDWMAIIRGIVLITFGVLMLVEVGNLLTNRAIVQKEHEKAIVDTRYENIRHN